MIGCINICKIIKEHVANGSVKTDSKMHQNMSNSVILPGSSDQLILDFIAPPELHMMLGLINF